VEILNTEKMLATIQGTYHNGIVSFDEKPQIDKEVKILITFLDDAVQSDTKKTRKAGGLKGQIWLADDFNEPLADLKDYM
jgi:hypothetical protein